MKRWVRWLAASLVLDVVGGYFLLKYTIPITESLTKLLGYDMHLSAIHVDSKHALFDGLALYNNGSRFNVLHADLQYSPLTLTLDAPRLELVHRADGSWTFPIALVQPTDVQTQAPISIAPRDSVIPALDIAIHHGEVVISAPDAPTSYARQLRFHHIELSLRHDSQGNAHFLGSTHYGNSVVRLHGQHRLTDSRTVLSLESASLPLADLIDTIVDRPEWIVDEGRLDDLSLHLVRLANIEHKNPVELYGHATVHDVSTRITGVTTPLRHINGTVTLGDAGLTTDNLQGDIAGIPFQATGGLTKLFSAQFNLKARLQGDVVPLHAALATVQPWPLHGHVTLGLRVVGPVSQPLVLARLDSRHLAWSHFSLDNPHLDLALLDNRLSLLAINGQNNFEQAQLGGFIDLLPTAHGVLVASAQGPAANLWALLALDDRGGMLRLRGNVTGDEVHVAGRLSPDQHEGWLAARITSPTGANGVATGILDRGLLLGGAQLHELHLPGILDRLQGQVSFAQLAGSQVGRTQGSVQGFSPLLVQASHLAIPTILLPTNISFDLQGNPLALNVASLQASGVHYSIKAHGIAGTQASALVGEVRGDLAPLGPALQGLVEGPFSLTHERDQTVIASPGLQVRHGRLTSFPIDRVVGRVRLGTHMQLAVAALGPAGQIIINGDPAQQLHLAIANISLDRLSVPYLHGKLDATAWVSHGVTGAAGLLLHDARYQGAPLGGLGALQGQATKAVLSLSSLRLSNVLASLHGTVGLLGSGHMPHYDLAARVRGAEAGSLLALFVPQTANTEPELQVNAQLRLRGSGAAPQLSGVIALPAGSIDGLALQNGAARIQANAGGFELFDGLLEAGHTHLRFIANSTALLRHASLRGTAVDLNELGDAFAPQTLVHGFGSVALDATLENQRLTSSGALDMHSLRLGDIPLGHARGRWHRSNDWIIGHLLLGGDRSHLNVDGAISPFLTQQWKLSRSTRLAASATLTGLNLAPHLALFGVHAPIQGTLDAQSTARGTLGNPQVLLSANVHDGSLAGLALVRATLQAALVEGKLDLRQAEILAQGLHVQGSGTLEALSLHAPLFAVVGVQSTNFDDLLTHVLGYSTRIDGAATTRLTLTGTLSVPKIEGVFALKKTHLAALPVNEIVARYAFKGSSLEVSDAEIALPRGTITVAGTLPFTLSPFALGPAGAPLALDLGVNDVDLAGLHSILPTQGGDLQGRISGAVALEGTPASPKLFGALSLVNGRLALRSQSSMIDDLAATLRFTGTSAQLDSHAKLGGGSLALQGKLQLPHLTDISSPMSSTQLALTAKTKNAHLLIPGFGSGTLDGSLVLTREPAQAPYLAGTLALSDAAIPTSLFLAQRGPAAQFPGSDLIGQTHLDIGLRLKDDVRLRSGLIDLGALGSVQLAGTVLSPSLDGSFAATGGSVTYLNRSFQVQSGRVAFAAADGVEPSIDATATTVVTDPDPSATQVSAGEATITLNLHGRPDHILVALSSKPSYSREQILGLLLGASLVGAVDLHTQDGGGLSSVNRNGPNAQGDLQNEALGLLNAQLTQNFLSPFTSALGGAVGLSNLGVRVGNTGTVALSASRRINGNVALTFEESLGVPLRQSLGLDFIPNDATALSVNVYQEQTVGAYARNGSGLMYQPGALTQLDPGAAGSKRAGIAISAQRHFP